MDRVRTPPQKPQTGNLRTTGSVVHQVDKRVADSERVHLTPVEEGLGRIMYVAGALDYERHFWGLCIDSSHFTPATQPDACRAVLRSSSGTSQCRSARKGTVSAHAR